MKKLISFILKKSGYELRRSVDLTVHFKLINMLNINTIIDVGANKGQYGLKMIKNGFKGKIISFEPLKSAFVELKNVSNNYPNWEVANHALGNEEMNTMINVSENSHSSSILEMMPIHSNIAPESKSIGKETISVKKLDDVFDSYINNDDRTMMKIDTQGFEKKVVEGASNVLNKISVLQLEMSIVPLYKNEMTFADMIKFLETKDFEMYSLDTEFSDPISRRLLQVDGLFIKKEPNAS